MIPTELKIDKDGLLYTDDKRIVKQSMILMDNYVINENRYDQSGFYRFISTDEYIVKYYFNMIAKNERELMREMLINLNSKQRNVSSVDFPIGYFKRRRYIQGLIVKYYKDGISLDNICNNHDLLMLGKYYYHEEDNLHNLFLLFDEILRAINEMFDAGVYYHDIHPGNMVLVDNKVKIIDFDPHRVKFDEKDKRLHSIMNNYWLFLKLVLRDFDLLEYFNDVYQNFEEAKINTKKLENEIRKRIR